MTDEQNPKLVLKAEALLAALPLREPASDAFAARIQSALGKAGPTDDSLLLPSLPESIEDGRDESVPQEIAAVASPQAELAAVASRSAEPATEAPRESASLADLARAAMARRENKEAVSLAKESLAIAAKGRSSVEPVVGATIIVEPERTTVPPTRKQREQRRQQERRGFDTRGPWIGVAIAAAGLAAGFGLYVRASGQKLVETPVAQGETATQKPTVLPAPNAGEAAPVGAMPAAKEGSAAAEPAPAAKEGSAASEPAPASPESSSHAIVAAKASGGADTRRSTPAAAAATRAEKVVLDEDHGPSPGTPAAAEKPASSAAMRPAELNANGGISDRPTTGAAQAAVGAVLGAARSCLAGQQQASSATIVFGSGGEVSGVSVNGPAQGTPAASCIQAALSRARVQPFAAANFSLGVTVRPP